MRQSLTVLVVSLTVCTRAAFDFKACNVTKGCWFQPPECTEDNPSVCRSAVEWELKTEGVLFTIRSFTDDLDSARAHWISVGWSLNQRMDDDTVLECIRRADGESRVQLSFNDETHNEVLWQASNALLQKQQVTFEDGLLSCSALVLYHGREQLPSKSRFKVHDLQNQSYYLLFARGSADIYSLEKSYHSMNDGALYPWTSGDTVSFCTHNCTHDAGRPMQITSMLQTFMERKWRYRIAVFHGIALTFAWWVLISNGILIARYFKPLFPKTKLFGTAVWFQLHRGMHVGALILQIISVLLIFWQAGWVWFECSYKCSPDDYAKKMHTNIGVLSTALAIVNGVLSYFRPSPHSRNRLIFNWAHWLCGMAAWSFASATIILSIPLGKAGLGKVLGTGANYLFGAYILVFVLVNVALEIITTAHVQIDRKTIKSDTPGMVMTLLHGPSTEGNKVDSKRSGARVAAFLVHVFASLMITVVVAVVLVQRLLHR